MSSSPVKIRLKDPQNRSQSRGFPPEKTRLRRKIGRPAAGERKPGEKKGGSSADRGIHAAGHRSPALEKPGEAAAAIVSLRGGRKGRGGKGAEASGLGSGGGLGLGLPLPHRRLDDLAAAQAPGADPDPAHAAVDQRPDPLEVGL